MLRPTLVALAFTATLLSAAPALGGGLLLLNPVVNGAFELVVPGGPALCQAAGDQEINLFVAIVDTCSPGVMKSVHWSSLDNTQFRDVDGNGDREAVFGIGPDPLAYHNLWQAWSSPHQLWSENFDALNFNVVAGAVPAGANIQVGFSLSPLEEQHGQLLIFWEGAVFFDSADIGAGPGAVSLNPVTEGSIVCPALARCAAFRDAFDAADAAGKAQLLGRARIVQLSFWNFDTGATPVAVDDVAIVGGTTFVEELARGNIDLDPPA